ncbi:UPF0481 protein At3g47200-like [Olea europaea var. sylvestris]|uniref:Uncharacterized protein n=1 Tax=Olea europaea subsp. europaea TaxID=158383 RepID=A0A8S0VD66_OLEEU|nr:UPF0481 protein At3g47200-like [Olea europaea var. sylvestris]CAA3028231.1 Hypothetical predicted protein [Olea europaea subsp. europaea]
MESKVQGMTTVEAEEDNQVVKITSDNTKDEWLISIDKYVHEKTKKTPIERVPLLLRKHKSYKNCCEPLLVSIGPYHHANPKFQAFEKMKIPFAQKFCHVCCDQVSIEQLYEEVAKVGKSARECYEEDPTARYDDELFNRMMFLDACFVLHFMFILRMENSSNWMDKELKDVYEQLYKNLYHVVGDLFLLENQIPLVVLNVLMKFMKKFKGNYIENFLELFSIEPPQTNSCTDAVKNFLKQMTGCCSESNAKEKPNLDESPHLLHFLREKLIFPLQPKGTNQDAMRRELYLSVTELKSAGIFFIPSQTRNLTVVEFKSRLIYGILSLPPVRVDDVSKNILLNLVAYEMCPHGPPDLYITSYICLMNSLIDHADDVKELKKRRILINHLGSDEQLAEFFNELSTDLAPDIFAYADAKSQIDEHCKQKGHIWMAEWIHKYFTSPWTLLAFLGAIFALALTMVQTYFAVYPRQT